MTPKYTNLRAQYRKLAEKRSKKRFAEYQRPNARALPVGVIVLVLVLMALALAKALILLAT